MDAQPPLLEQSSTRTTVLPNLDPVTNLPVLPRPPPFETDNAQSFAASVAANSQAWYDYVALVMVTYRHLDGLHNELQLYNSAIKSDFESSQDRVTALENENTGLKSLLTAQCALADELRKSRDGLQIQVDGISEGRTTPRHESKSEKMPDIEIYNGDRDKLTAWITDLKIKMNANRDRFASEQSKLAYAVSRLGGKAKDQVNVYIKEDTIDLENLAAFIKVIETAFGDPDRKGTAQRTLTNLRQRNLDFSTYLAEFNRHAQYTEWCDEAKKSALFTGLSDELKQLLVTFNYDDLGLQEFMQKIQQLDNRARSTQATMRPVRATTRFQSSTTTITPRVSSAAATTTTVPASGTPGGSVPMDLSNTQRRIPRGPLTQDEKTRRRQQNLCLYCGGAGHMAASCPQKPQSQQLRQATLTTTDSSAQAQSSEPAKN